ncbi:hypothetical protein ACWDUI_30625 [Streptosporangium sandarakinum]|uniref:hypothetical protein n=1 Tax=Streptosporangium nondiastaticum TaxID=35764 RepID=UPI0031F78FE1
MRETVTETGSVNEATAALQDTFDTTARRAYATGLLAPMRPTSGVDDGEPLVQAGGEAGVVPVPVVLGRLGHSFGRKSSRGRPRLHEGVDDDVHVVCLRRRGLGDRRVLGVRPALLRLPELVLPFGQWSW